MVRLFSATNPFIADMMNLFSSETFRFDITLMKYADGVQKTSTSALLTISLISVLI